MIHLKIINIFHHFLLFVVIVILYLPARAFPAKKELPDVGHLTVINLNCESRKNPLGIDKLHPRLGWNMKAIAMERGQNQTAFRIQVASSKALLLSGKPDLWDSGKVDTSLCNNIPYKGDALASGIRCYWRVMVWDINHQASGWSSVSFWDMGLLNDADWKGRWITDTKTPLAEDSTLFGNDPAPLFRKEFAVNKKIKKAFVYVSGLGYYEASLNGNKIGNRLLDPGWTDYSKRVLYSTYDVTTLIKPGDNCLGILLGNGWYNPLPLLMFGRFNLREYLSVGVPKFILQMNIEYTDGTSIQVQSDNSWKVTDGPVIRNSIYLGEVYDARKEIPRWNRAGLNTNYWRPVGFATAPGGKLQSQQQPPIVAGDTLLPQKIRKTNAGKYMVDFGKNFSGIIRLNAKGKAGTEITIRYGELLYPDGGLNVMTGVAGQIKWKNGGKGAPDTAYAKDVFILAGKEKDVFQPYFTFHGFRYAEISGYPGELKTGDIKALVLYSDLEDAGNFTCSVPMLNQLQQVCRNTFLSNVFSVQSDCPHRERFGYGGDIVATSEAFINNFDMAGFYEKTVIDFADAAGADGGLTETAPFVGISDAGLTRESAPVEWGTALPVLLNNLYQYYGNIELIENQYPTAKNWVDFMSAHAKDDIISNTIGDHESLETKLVSPSATAYYYFNACLLVHFAELLNKQTDIEKYTALANRIKTAFISKFFNPASGNIDSHTAAAQAYALYFNLIPGDAQDAVLKVLLHQVNTVNKDHIASGIFGTKLVMEVLSNAGYSDLVYKMVNQKSFPGWGYMLDNGATTLWEHWAFSDNTYSHNHPMFGTVSEWFYRWLAGIRPADDAVGFNKLIIQPQTNSLQWVKASYKSVLGNVFVDWKKAGRTLSLDLTIPVNAGAEVYIPAKVDEIKEGGKVITTVKDIRFLRMENNNAVFQVGSGSYHFSALSFVQTNNK